VESLAIGTDWAFRHEWVRWMQGKGVTLRADFNEGKLQVTSEMYSAVQIPVRAGDHESKSTWRSRLAGISVVTGTSSSSAKNSLIVIRRMSIHTRYPDSRPRIRGARARPS
jgi:hypothetical protein